MDIPTLPVAPLISELVRWMHVNLGFAFDPLTTGINTLDEVVLWCLRKIPPPLFIAAGAAFTFWMHGFKRCIGVAIPALIIWNLGLWQPALSTISLVLIVTAISIAIGIPLGVLGAENVFARNLMRPVLDFMQATPVFVYLIPNVLFFGIGTAPAVLASVMFALPPPLRAAQLGILRVDSRIQEAALSFGSSRMQMLFKVKIPLALPFVMVGVNQCIMTALNGVVIGALIGARGLGTEVVSSLSTLDIARGIEAGCAVVLIAIMFDRLTRSRDMAKP